MRGTKQAFFLLAGDIVFWGVALWATLLVRYVEVPTLERSITHLWAFGPLFILWALVFFIADLYAHQTLFRRSRLPQTILKAQMVNSLLAVLVFYFIPYFEIAPKTNLFIDLVFSFVFVSCWRVLMVPLFARARAQTALVLGEGGEVDELVHELSENTQYKTRVVRATPNDDLEALVQRESVTLIIFNPRDAAFRDVSARLHTLLFQDIRFIDLHSLYEDIFGRVPISLTDDNWFLERISNDPKKLYSFIKRTIDIAVSIFLGVIALGLSPFVALLIKLDDRGPLFIYQPRMGKRNTHINIIKWRTMSASDEGKWVKEGDKRITRVGAFLRRSRIDELPQLINVLKGELSLIGPRPELPKLVHLYTQRIPYYDMRHLIKPGLSGWAQIHHDKPPHSVEETAEKLSYDLYYIENRGMLLDLAISLKTIKTLLSRTGI